MHLKMEDTENRSRRNNLRIQDIPEAMMGQDLRAVAVTIFKQFLNRVLDIDIKIDQIQRVQGRRSDQQTVP